MKIILVSGKARHGKDTFAGMLKERLETRGQRVLLTHYADLLKYICREFFGWDGSKDESGRHLLQFVGTDVIRKQNPDAWVDFIISILKYFPKQWDYVIIPDCRFPNEIDRVRESGFDVTHIKVMRPNFVSPLTIEQQNHPSETALDDVRPDMVFCNSGTLEEMREGLDKWIGDAFK